MARYLIRRHVMRPRVIALLFLWGLPLALCVVISLIALYESGWWVVLAWSLPAAWLVAWLIGKYWQPPSLNQASHWAPLEASAFWTPRDIAAIAVVEEFRRQVADVDQLTIADPQRYLQDAQALAHRLSQHFYPQGGQGALAPMTPVEILAVVHLAVEDLEQWTLEHVPGSNLATVHQIGQLPQLARAWDIGQSLFFLATSITNPARLLTYPVWRGTGRVVVELQNELLRGFYQHYLSQVGFYLIEMYSGRLRGGSRQYREQFGHLARAVHAAGGDVSQLPQLAELDTTIAVMGQVKAGKSSLVNALLKGNAAKTSILPQTRQVQGYEWMLPGSKSVLRLLDTPGYSEANITAQQRAETKSAAEAADIILLVMAANVPARHSDLELVRELQRHYQARPHLRSPPIIGVLTHIDLLRPVRDWNPLYDWRQPTSPKEQSMAQAVDYAREVFGDALVDYACVYTRDPDEHSSAVEDELVPILMAHLDQGHAAAVLKAFYTRLSRQRLQTLARQGWSLLKEVGRRWSS